MRRYTRKAYLFLGLAIASVILHNVIFALTKKEEGMFFTLTFVFLIIFIILLVYNVVYLRGKNK